MDFTACQFCGGAADLLCDHILGFPPGADGRPEQPDWKANPYTCDAPICGTCALQVASGVMCTRGTGCEPFSTDHCPVHRYSEGRDLDAHLVALTPADALRRRLVAWNSEPAGPPALPPNRPPPKPKRKAA